VRWKSADNGDYVCTPDAGIASIASADTHARCTWPRPDAACDGAAAHP